MGQQKEKIIYDAKYYQLKKVAENPKFLEKIRSLKNQFAKFGCPIPAKGFRDGKEFYAWHEKLWKINSAILQGAEYKKAIHEFTKDFPKQPKNKGGAALLPEKQFYELEDLKDSMTPPVTYGYDFDEILHEFGLDHKDKENQDWIEDYFFFNQKEYLHTLYIIHFKTNAGEKKKKPSKELWIRIFGYTKLSDISPALIAEYQKQLPDYIGHNKLKDERIAERNKDIVNQYLIEIRKKEDELRVRRPAGSSIYTTVKKALKNKHPELTDAIVKTTVASWKKKHNTKDDQSNKVNLKTTASHLP